MPDDTGSLFENWWCWILAGLSRVTDPLPSLPPGAWTPDRRPVRAIPLYNGSDFPWGLNQLWKEGGVPWLLATMQAAHDKGFRRFMWTLPAGRTNEPNVPWPAAQWQLLDDSGITPSTPTSTVRRDLVNLISPWLRHRRDVQLIVYLGGIIKSAYNRDTHGAWVPDPRCPRDLRIMHLNFDGFTKLSPDHLPNQIGFWFDNSSPEEKRRKEYRVVEWLRARSLWGGMEAVANDNLLDGDNSTNRPVAAYVGRVPMFGVRHFFDPTVFDPPAPNSAVIRDARKTWKFRSDASEIGFFLHAYHDSDPHGLSLAEGEAMLREYHNRGFILGTYVERWEDAIMSIVTGG
jgi:hypothetical protein